MAAVPGETLRLVEKHTRAIRWMHWINFPVLFVMIWSGLLIYWGDSIPPYQHAHQVYRIGIGSFTLVRFFPDWFWNLLNAPYQITTGLGFHWLFMWFFAVNGIAYFSYLAISGEWRVLWPQRRSFVDALWVTLYDLHVPVARRKGLPAQGKYNGAQRIAYTAVVLMGGASLLTGLAIYKPTQAHWLTTLLGGYEMARWEHFWLTMGFCGFFLVHVGQVILAGWNNFRSMVSGYEIQSAPQHVLLPEATVVPPAAFTIQEETVPPEPVLETLPEPSTEQTVLVDPMAIEEALANEPPAEEIAGERQEGEHE